jgi:hypothetical protein
MLRLVADVAAPPTASMSQACGARTAIKAAYRFCVSPQVQPAAIRQAHHHRTVERVQQWTRVLATQDTTNMDFTHHPAHRGLRVHSVLAVSWEGVPLGRPHQAVWAGDPQALGQRYRWRQRATSAQGS